MALPPGFLDELRARVSLARVAGRKVAWDARKTNAARGDYWAACPFHQERTASFHVDDRKGVYYCFGCHAKGGAIDFVMQTENAGFIEAVEMLAREAGMAMPAPDPAAQARADRRAELSDVLEEAIRFYRLQLKTAAAADARTWLARRGLTAAAIDRFEIGYAPDPRQALFGHLRGKGIAADRIVEAGLAGTPADGGAPWDRFRHRIQFPIRDPRGRAIAFGGRALSDAVPAKYLNSPQTLLFDKGRTLFNHGPAREAAGKGAPLIVVEGYMDVIALVGAGFGGAVAPLGTAITETQLDLMWRIAPEPVIALDGDAAGLRAVLRLIDLALPRLEPGRSLRFALLPAGQDPDDLIRAGGAAAMQAVLDAAVPPVDLIWRRETEGHSFDSPERRAALDARLKALTDRIRDADLRRHWFAALRERRAALFGWPGGGPAGRRAGGAGRAARGAPAGPTEAARRSVLARASDGKGTGRHTTILDRAEDAALTDRLCEAAILALCLAWPELVADAAHGLESLECADPEHRALLAALLRHAPGLAGNPDALRAALVGECGTRTLEKLDATGHLAVVPALLPGADPALARRTLDHEIARLAARRGARCEIGHAMEDFADPQGEGLTWRLREAAAALNGPATPVADPAAGAAAEQSALSARLQALIDGEVWVKGKPAK
jgi:DNA primase